MTVCADDEEKEGVCRRRYAPMTRRKKVGAGDGVRRKREKRRCVPAMAGHLVVRVKRCRRDR